MDGLMVRTLAARLLDPGTVGRSDLQVEMLRFLTK